MQFQIVVFTLEFRRMKSIRWSSLICHGRQEVRIRIIKRNRENPWCIPWPMAEVAYSICTIVSRCPGARMIKLSNIPRLPFPGDGTHYCSNWKARAQKAWWKLKSLSCIEKGISQKKILAICRLCLRSLASHIIHSWILIVTEENVWLCTWFISLFIVWI